MLLLSIGTGISVIFIADKMLVEADVIDEDENLIVQGDEVLPTEVLPSSQDKSEPISLFFGGDVMLDRNVATRIKNAKDDRYPFLKIMDDERFTDADLQVINLEGPVTDPRRAPIKSIDFMFDPRFIPVLKTVGFDALSQANNHALDQGRAGADDSRRRLISAGFLVFGDEAKDDDVAIATTTVKGKRLAFAGFNSTSNPIDKLQAEKVLQQARASADYLIVFMHWGEEYRDHPTRDQIARAEWLVDNGADIVIGGHPHWVEGIASYKGKPIMYSLGNFVFDQDWSEETKKGLATRISITDSNIAFELFPVQIDKSQPYFADGEELKKRLRDLALISEPSLASQIEYGVVSFPLNSEASSTDLSADCH